MKCPACGTDKVETGETRRTLNNTVVLRRRYCRACPHRFTTYEFEADDVPDECFSESGIVRTPREAVDVAIETQVSRAVNEIIRRLNITNTPNENNEATQLPQDRAPEACSKSSQPKEEYMDG